MQAPRKRIVAAFYRAANGGEPVREWLKGLDRDDRRTIGMDIAAVEYGWPAGKPLCGSLGGGLWEVRSHIGGGRIARVIFCIVAGRMVLLHGFIKKTRKIPGKDRGLALGRKREIAP